MLVMDAVLFSDSHQIQSIVKYRVNMPWLCQVVSGEMRGV